MNLIFVSAAEAAHVIDLRIFFSTSVSVPFGALILRQWNKLRLAFNCTKVLLAPILFGVFDAVF